MDRYVQTYTRYIMNQLILLGITFLSVLKNGTAMQQFLSVVMFSTLLGTGAIVLEFMNAYVFPDPQFAHVFLIGLMCDTLAGVIKHIKKKEFDGKDMILGMAAKLGIGLLVMMFTKAILNMPEVVAFDYLSTSISLFLKTSIIAWIGGSFLGSIYEISGGRIPPPVFMERFRKYQLSGNPKDLLKEDEMKE